MSAAASCSALSLASGEPLAGTATRGDDWLLVESRGPWGRDAIGDSGLADALRAELEAYPGKVVLIRRPDRKRGATVIRAAVGEARGTATRLELESLEGLSLASLDAGEPLGAVVLVCAHGRRDACCARLGAPLFEALGASVAPGQLWQASHLGGHRFAPNVLVLPHGIQLGRIPVSRAHEVAELAQDGRIPLDLYRGRTIYPPDVQAAEIAVREAGGWVGIDDLRLVSTDDGSVTFETPAGARTARVEALPRSATPVSCGAAPEPGSEWVVSLES